jgi:hypothetical protein
MVFDKSLEEPEWAPAKARLRDVGKGLRRMERREMREEWLADTRARIKEDDAEGEEDIKVSGSEEEEQLREKRWWEDSSSDESEWEDFPAPPSSPSSDTPLEDLLPPSLKDSSSEEDSEEEILEFRRPRPYTDFTVFRESTDIIYRR